MIVAQVRSPSLPPPPPPPQAVSKVRHRRGAASAVMNRVLRFMVVSCVGGTKGLSIVFVPFLGTFANSVIPFFMRNRESIKEKTLRALLRKRRLNLHLTQRELARERGFPHTFVSKYETGERYLTFTEVMDLCRLLDLDIHDVVDELLAAGAVEQASRGGGASPAGLTGGTGAGEGSRCRSDFSPMFAGGRLLVLDRRARLCETGVAAGSPRRLG